MKRTAPSELDPDLSEAKADFLRADEALSEALRGIESLPFRLPRESAASIIRGVERARPFGEGLRGAWESSWSDSAEQIRRAKMILAAAKLSNPGWGDYYDETFDSIQEDLSAKARLERQRDDELEAYRRQNGRDRALAERSRLFREEAAARRREAELARALALAFSGSALSPSQADLLRDPIPVASFSEPSLARRHPRGQEYALWDLALLCGSLPAARAAAALWAAPRPRSSEFGAAALKEGRRLESPLVSALGLERDFSGLSARNPFPEGSLAAVSSWRLCRHGLAPDPAAFFSEAVSALGASAFPFADLSCAPLERASRNAAAWKGAAALLGGRSPSSEAGEFSAALLALADGPALGGTARGAALAARARSLRDGLSCLPEAAFGPRQRMLLTALEAGDSEAASAMLALGVSLRDPADPRGDSFDRDSAPPPPGESLRDRILAMGFPFPESFLDAASADPDPWSASGGADALALMAFSMRKSRKIQPEPVAALARRLAAFEPFPGLVAELLSELAAARPSHSLRMAAEAFALEASLPEGAGRAPRRSL